MKPLLVIALMLVAVTAHAAPPSSIRQGPFAHMRASWTMDLPKGSSGYGFAFVAADEYPSGIPSLADWVEPNLHGSLGIGFDAKDPKTKNAFNADGNIYGRPEREVSLHWNGVEIANRLSPVEFREGAHKVRVSADAVVGGLNVTVLVDGTPVYRNYFVPGAAPFAFRSVFATGQSDPFAGVAGVDVDGFGALPPAKAPLNVVALDKALNDKEHQTLTSLVDFPAETAAIGRVTCTLTLGETPNGVDPWDRMAALYVYDDAGKRIEVLRYMTPYDRGYSWTVDVTDYLPILTGKRKVELCCETWGAGWLVSADFHFYPGEMKRRPVAVHTLYDATPVIGQADKPLAAAIRPTSVALPPGATDAKLRFIVTGHGQAPNTENAAEFIALNRTVKINDRSVTNLLWKTDNYLNPCRPQGGTWKYDRAGWGPGDVVTPWDLYITPDLKDGRARVSYSIAPYTNKTPDHGNPARQWITGQVIYYR